MTKKYDELPTIELSDHNTYTHPEAMPELVHLDDSALSILTDFEKIKPAIAHPDDNIDDTLTKMKSSGRLVMLVVENHTVVGAVSSGDLQGEKPLKLVQENRVNRKEILVKQVMTPDDSLLAINYQDLRFAKIGNLLRTLRKHMKRYALIVDIDETTKAQRIHGLINVYDIIKRLDRTLTSAIREAQSILELQSRL